MNHTHYQELTSQFIDGEIGIDEEQKLFEHLGLCDECRQFLRMTLKMDADILATRGKESSLSSAPHLVPAIQDSRLLKKLWRANIPAPIAFGAAVILVVIGLFLTEPRQSTEEMQSQSVQDAKGVMSMPTIVVSQK